MKEFLFTIYGVFIMTVITLIAPAFSIHIVLALILGKVTQLIWDKS